MSEIRSKMYVGLQESKLLFLSETSIFLTIFIKSPLSNFVKIHLVGAELFHADTLIDREDKANSYISQFCDSTQGSLSYDLKT
jgi:hypothetical protein